MDDARADPGRRWRRRWPTCRGRRRPGRSSSTPCPNFHNPAGVTLSEPRREARSSPSAEQARPADHRGQPVRPARLRRRAAARRCGRPQRPAGHLPRLVLQDVLPGPAGRLGARAARRPREAGPGHRGAGALPAVAHPVRRRPLPGHPAVAGADQDRSRELYRERRDATLESLAALMPAGTAWTKPDGGFYVWLKLPDGLDAKADAAARGHRARGLRARHRLLRRRQRPRVHAAVLLLPDAGPDPRGRPPAGRASSRPSWTCTRTFGASTPAPSARSARRRSVEPSSPGQQRRYEDGR